MNSVILFKSFMIQNHHIPPSHFFFRVGGDDAGTTMGNDFKSRDEATKAIKSRGCSRSKCSFLLPYGLAGKQINHSEH